MRSQRMTVLLTPEAKALIEARARTLGITSSELARRAIEAYDPRRDEQALRLLAAELATVVDQTEAKLDSRWRFWTDCGDTSPLSMPTRGGLADERAR